MLDVTVKIVKKMRQNLDLWIKARYHDAKGLATGPERGTEGPKIKVLGRNYKLSRQ